MRWHPSCAHPSKGGCYVSSNWTHRSNPTDPSPYLSLTIARWTMNAKRQWWAFCMVTVMALCGLVACNRDSGVEAAREGQPPMVSPAEQDFTMKAMRAHLAE